MTVVVDASWQRSSSNIEEPEPDSLHRRVRVWFGEYIIVEKVARPALASQLADGWRRRFPGLRVTNDPALGGAIGSAPRRVAADFEYPLATGARVPTASVDGLCALCNGAWPCLRCPDLVEVFTG